MGFFHILSAANRLPSIVSHKSITFPAGNFFNMFCFTVNNDYETCEIRQDTYNVHVHCTGGTRQGVLREDHR